MFTGIIEEMGRVESLSRRGTGYLLTVLADRVVEGTGIGDSIAVNGVCLTVVKIAGSRLSFDVMAETFKATNLGLLSPAARVNLERSLRTGDRVGGHFVSGHVDCRGTVRSRRQKAGNLCFEIAVPAAVMHFFVGKGAVAGDGISLTVMGKASASFRVYIIPHTAEQTTLGFKGPSGVVNVETDMLVKAACQKH
jgi:riboflavin synthase